MGTFVHPTAYRFYYTPLPNGTKVDIESTYNCRYMRFDNLISNGDQKNSYSEDYAEQSGARVYIPDNVAHKAYDCKLKLLLKGDQCQVNLRNLESALMGTKVEWSDTFRNRFATLLMTKAPNIVSSRLYGNQQFIEVEFTFTNILGQTFAESQIQ